MIYATVQLINSYDVALTRKNMLDKDEVKQMTIEMLADSGAYMLCINENIQAQLQLPFVEKRKVVLANGSIEEYDVVGPVMVKFKNRTAICSAFVLRADAEPLLGVIPMEEMDVLLHPQRQELIVNPEHPYYAQLKLK